MKRTGLATYFRNHLSARIFLAFSTLIIVVSLAFTIFFFRYQSRSLTEKTVSKGELLASLFAHNSQLGVFTENAALLKAPIDGILENREVLAVAVYSASGKTIAAQNRAGSGLSPGTAEWDPRIGEMLNKNTSALHFRTDGHFIFWTRVDVASHAYVSQEDAVYFDDQPPKENEQAIGFVRLILDGHPLQKSLQGLLFDSILIGVAFLAVGSVIAYLIAGRVTRPLNRLIEGVNAFAKGECKLIAVESDDEIGNLAAAFNEMVESVRKREGEKEELEEQLRHSQKMEAIGTMAGGIAHDFNNILTAIYGYGTLLLSRLDEGSKQWAYADQIIKSGERAANLTQRLLAYSRKQIISPRPIDLNEAVRNIEKMLTRLITEDIELQFCLGAENSTVMADLGQIDQVLLNLVTNARDAMPRGGTIRITTGVTTLEENFVMRHGQEPMGSYVMLTVGDNGVGMTEEIAGKIFDPYYTTKEVGKGTGLGLSVVFGIVKQHNGIIEVDTEIGKGALFRIYLPLSEPPREEPKRKASSSLQGNAATILVAEDDVTVMGYLKELLERTGYSVIEAANGKAAVEKFDKHKDIIRLALLDVIMPQKNGREVCKEITRANPDVRVLFMSGYTQDVIDWKEALEGGLCLIQKPVRPDELLARIKELLET